MFWSHIACAPKRDAFGHAGTKSKSKCDTLFRRTSSPSRAFADMDVGNDSVSRSADLCLNESYHEKGPRATPVPRSEFQHHQSLHSPGKVHIFFGSAMLLYASGFVPPQYCSLSFSTVSTAILTLDLVALLLGLGYGTVS